MTKLEDLDTYILTFPGVNGVPFTQLSQPVELNESDKIRVSIEPVHPGLDLLPKTQEFIVTMTELRGMAEQCKGNRLNLVTELTGESGAGAGKVELNRRFVETILRDRMVQKPLSSSINPLKD
jgi:hypothetical protein